MIAVPKNKHFQLVPMGESHFGSIRDLASEVFEPHYLTLTDIEEGYQKSCAKGPTSSFVVLLDGRLIGFRLTYGPGTWDITRDYTPEKWNAAPEQVCYFKVACVHPDYSGLGLGQVLLDGAVGVSRRQGAIAGVADIWLNSPHNSAYKYFSKAGGEVVNIHHGRWAHRHSAENPCDICGPSCRCIGAEMILHFGEAK